jgi:ParB family chromosome partitioning protein
MGKRVSLASMAGDEVVEVPGVDPMSDPVGQWLPIGRCLPNPRNPRDHLGDLSDLASIKERQLQSLLAISPPAYLRLWPEDETRLGAAADSVIIINGNRRRAAAEKYGRENLLVVVDDGVATSRAAVRRAAYDENTSRKDFDPIEEARAVLDIVGEYPTAKEAARAEGWSESWISHRKNLLKLHPELQDLVRLQAAGGEGLAINVARRLGSVRGIDQMSLEDQLAALAELLSTDAASAEAKKETRRAARRTGQDGPSEQTNVTPIGKFSAENPQPDSDESLPPSGRPQASSAASPPKADLPGPVPATRGIDVPGLAWDSPSEVADALIANMKRADLHTVATFLQAELSGANK